MSPSSEGANENIKNILLTKIALGQETRRVLGESGMTQEESENLDKKLEDFTNQLAATLGDEEAKSYIEKYSGEILGGTPSDVEGNEKYYGATILIGIRTKALRQAVIEMESDKKNI